MWLDWLIVVDDEISSSFLLDDEGNKAIIWGRHVERGFIARSPRYESCCVGVNGMSHKSNIAEQLENLPLKPSKTNNDQQRLCDTS
jgi:hypothetical protein